MHTIRSFLHTLVLGFWAFSLTTATVFTDTASWAIHPLLSAVCYLDAKTRMLVDATVHAVERVLEPAKPFVAFAKRLLRHERYRTSTGFSEMRSIA